MTGPSQPRDAALERAAALYQAGRLDEARAIAMQLVAANPAHFNALHLLAALAVRAGRAQEALEFASRALALVPGHPEALCNRGIALRALDRIDEALADYDAVLAARPDYVPALNLKGVALAALNRHAEAIACYSKALAKDSRFAPAHLNRGLSELVTGELEAGWRDHEWRWTGSDTQIPLRRFAEPQWRGEDIRGRTILIHAEQGLGDAIQMARYVPLLAARGANVVLEVQAPLEALFAQLPATVVRMGAALPRFDCHAPMLSLPLAFATRLETIPRDVPYLHAPPPHVEKWRARLGSVEGLRVGIAWSGSTTLRNDRQRSIALERFDALRADGRTLVSLQKDVREDDRATLARMPGIRHFGDELEDFRDTAALASLMEVVVSVDTSVAHLAGAMARPTWVLLPFSPDWRWLLGRDDSPWYPTARLFRQERRGDWASVMTRVAEALAALAAA